MEVRGVGPRDVMIGRTSTTAFYTMCGVTGFTAGYWAVFVTVAAEQYGTNLRATVATTTPNFVRGSGVLLAVAWEWLAVPLGFVGAAVVAGSGIYIWLRERALMRKGRMR